MSDERRRGEDGDESGPGLLYMPFVVMEDLLDKLRLLDYEQDFSRKMNLKPLSRHYFALAKNPGEQFYMFTSLAAWLLRKAGRNFEQPQEYDDPNATISSILEELRKLGHSVDFAPSRLKQGCGEHCIFVLDRLADEALRALSFGWKKPMYPEEEQDEDVIVEDDSELMLNKADHEVALIEEADDYEDEEEPLLDLEGLKQLNQRRESSKPEEILESQTDAADWKLEVERVLPQLKVTIRTDNKDWRSHVEQMHQHQQGIETSLVNTKSQLGRLHEDLARSMEKINSRERYLNRQLEPTLAEFRTLQDQLAEVRERYRQASGGVTERSRLLAEVTEDLDKVKGEMEDRGSSMTDGAPLVRIKQSLQQLKKEISQMDIRIGVLEHVLLQARLKDRNSQRREVHSAV